MTWVASSMIWAKMNKPHMYYWTKDEVGTEWEILLVGDYEMFEDGDAIVSDLDVKHYAKITIDEGVKIKTYIDNPEYVPDEIVGFADTLLDDKDTYLDIQKDYEENRWPLFILGIVKMGVRFARKTVIVQCVERQHNEVLCH